MTDEGERKKERKKKEKIQRGSLRCTHYPVDICIVDADFTRFVNIFQNCYIVMMIIITLPNRIPKK